MRCPRCGSDNERDVSKAPCSRCGLLVRMPERSRGSGRPVSPGSVDPLIPDYTSNPFLTRLHTSPPDTPPPGRQSSTPESSSANFWQEHGTGKTTTGPLRSPERPRPVTSMNETAEDPFLHLERGLHASHMYAPNQSETEQAVKDKAAAFTSQEPRDFSLHEGIMLVNASSLLTPGTLLRGGRYRLQEYQGYQEWLDGVYEATWVAQDAQRAGMRVSISELAIPDTTSVPVQTMLRQATMALTSIGRHPNVPTLWDAFGDQGEHIFVFEPAEGETLFERMRRTGRACPEQLIVEMGLQVLDVLASASQQMPPLLHGLIRPEHIVLNRIQPVFKLTNFSIVLAGRAMQLVSGIDSLQTSPYFSPEFIQGKIDGHADLYALVATMYHTVTGSIPSAIEGVIPEARRLNPTISSALNDLLAKGLHPLPEHRFQRPPELRQALLALLRKEEATRETGTDEHASRPLMQHSVPESVQASLSTQQQSSQLPLALNIANVVDIKPGTRISTLDEIALIDGRNTNRIALAIIIGIVVCLLVVLALWRFLLY